MYITVAFLWVSVWRVQDIWPIIGKLQIPIVLEIALAATLLTSLNGPRNPRWLKSRVLTLPFCLLVIMVAGLPFSIWREIGRAHV